MFTKVFLISYVSSVVLFNACFCNERKECYGYHEVYRVCGPACPPTCYDLIEQPVCNKEDVCVKGCFCIHGYLRDAENRCVLPRDCFPKTEKPICTSEEVYEKCNANCENTCDNYGTHFSCPRRCQPGCVCGEGLVRNEEGNCIPPQFCRKFLTDPSPCNSSLEEFHYCFAACEQTCDNLGMELDCYDKCKAGCICKEGLVRDDKGQCIIPKYCKNQPTTDGFCSQPHEVFSCGPSCDVTCSHLGEPCKKFSFDCVKKCYCQKGYARDHRNICIPIRKCPLSCRQSLLFFLTFIKH